jgi:prepilin-type N-terminal cleavage/methylation domain-containing protein
MKKTRSGFTLIEMLTAIAVLSLMMVFMFNIAGQTVRAWDVGLRRIESAQSARIGMNLLASELRYAFAGVATNYGTNASQVYTNCIPFCATNGALPGETSTSFTFVPGSQSIFFASPVGPHDPSEAMPLAEVGYLTTFVTKADGAYNMYGGTYALVRHGASPGVYTTNNDEYQNFYYRGTPDNAWIKDPATTGNRTPIVDNCIRLSLQFASNNSGAVSWSTNWTSQTSLPLGVLVTMLVLDSKSAAKLRQLGGTTVLPAAVIDKATNDAVLDASDAVGRLLRQGTTVTRRFVPLVNSYYSR